MVVPICSDGLLNDLGVVQAMGCCVLHLLRPTIVLVQDVDTSQEFLDPSAEHFEEDGNRWLVR